MEKTKIDSNERMKEREEAKNGCILIIIIIIKGENKKWKIFNPSIQF